MKHFYQRLLFETGSAIAFLYALIEGEKPCLCCQKAVYNAPLCASCQKRHFYSREGWDRRCLHCGRELLSEKRVCTACRTAPVITHTDSAFSLFPYLLWYKEALTAWKTGGERSLSAVFAHAIAYAIHARFSADMPLVPVPPRPGKICKTGWDQVEALCRVLECRYGKKICRVLRRLSNEEQKKRNRQERLAELAGSYCLKDKACLPDELILIDDVMTTGSTIETCAAALKSGGAGRVHALTICAVP